jgi:hypothetical protein
MRYVFTKPKSTDFSRIQGVFSSRSVLIENTNVLSNLTPLTDERFNYNAMIEYVTIKKLKG